MLVASVLHVKKHTNSTISLGLLAASDSCPTVNKICWWGQVHLLSYQTNLLTLLGKRGGRGCTPSELRLRLRQLGRRLPHMDRTMTTPVIHHARSRLLAVGQRSHPTQPVKSNSYGKMIATLVLSLADIITLVSLSPPSEHETRRSLSF